MKFLTLNINSIRAHIESFLDILRAGEYDTILVQELKVETAAFPHNLFDEFGYNIKAFGQKSWNGVAIFSKYSIEDVVRGLPNYPDVNARFMECVIDGRIRIINVYMPNGESEESPKFPYKIEWMQKFGEYIAPLLASEEPVIIGGDFNVAIEDRDVWNPKNYEGSSISAPAAREIMGQWLGRNEIVSERGTGGWLECWRHFNPDVVGYTWFGYRGFGGSLEKNQGLRLDYFIANKAAAKLVKDCHIDARPRHAEKPTDHCGLVLEIA
jgi:exodeoxyribonuclease-3